MMKAADMENLIFTRHTKSKMGRGKQSATYLMSLCQQMSQRVRGKDSNRNKSIVKCYKGGKIVKRHELSLPDGTRNKTKKKSTFFYISKLIIYS